MIRYEVLKTLLPVISDELVVCNIGSPSQELHALDLVQDTGTRTQEIGRAHV